MSQTTNDQLQCKSCYRYFPCLTERGFCSACNQIIEPIEINGYRFDGTCGCFQLYGDKHIVVGPLFYVTCETHRFYRECRRDSFEAWEDDLGEHDRDDLKHVWMNRFDQMRSEYTKLPDAALDGLGLIRASMRRAWEQNSEAGFAFPF